VQTVLPSPTPEPTPTAVPTPRRDVFDPNDGNTPLTKLNDATNPRMPDKFRVTRVDTGELLWIQGVDTVQSGTPPKDGKVYGKPDIARLAGIVTPAPGKPGFAETIKTVQNWTLGQEVDVEQDPRFPVDLSSRRMIQIYFNGRIDRTKGIRFNLNRMMVRSGYAVVDLNAPTTIDVKPWLNDEQYARDKRLGLWGKGIILGQRKPLPTPAPQGQVRGAATRNSATQSTSSRISVTTSGTTNTTTSSPAPAGNAAPGSAPSGSAPSGSAPSTAATPGATAQ
jgi:endonuclease YncB( thermonuclease family)